MKKLFLILLVFVSTSFSQVQYRLATHAIIEGGAWVGLFLVLPDAHEYRDYWFKQHPTTFYRDFHLAWADGNNGWLIDKVAHPFLGSTIYGALEESGYHPMAAFGFTCVHSFLWEMKEYPKTKHVEMKDVAFTCIPSFLYAIGDIIANNAKTKFGRIVGYTLSSPSHTGKFLFKGTLGLIRKKRRGY